jgi:hypothetical protein
MLKVEVEPNWLNDQVPVRCYKQKGARSRGESPAAHCAACRPSSILYIMYISCEARA